MPTPMRLEPDGAELVPGVFGVAALDDLRGVLAGVPPGRSGVRLRGVPGLREIVDATVGPVVAGVLGPGASPVRAVLFDKTAAANWALGWHQDRTVAVARRLEVPGFGPWSVKDGMPHVAPPMAVLERMLTVRVHLDAVGDGNAPLLVAPGSHRLGRVPVGDVAGVVARCGTRACPAAAGDLWVYSTPVLHASDAARVPERRRVLQMDYAAFALPGGLEWLGV